MDKGNVQLSDGMMKRDVVEPIRRADWSVSVAKSGQGKARAVSKAECRSPGDVRAYAYDMLLF